jgi:DNA-binding HxlR family transcriptional regulator
MQVKFAIRVPVLGKTYDEQNCSAARALEVVGERWSLLIITRCVIRRRDPFHGLPTQPRSCPNVLASRLEGFVAAGLMIRQATPSPRDHHDYLFTERGRDLQPVIIALLAWGDQQAAPDGPPVLLEHVGCGGSINQPTRCASCDQVLDPTSDGPAYQDRLR